MNWIRRILGLIDWPTLPPPEDAVPTEGWVVHDGHGAQPLAETERGKLWKQVGVDDTCPDCGSHGFYNGPRGGMSQNIFCINRDCRSGFNITPLGDNDGWCDRIHKGEIERYPKPAADAAA